MRSTEIIAGDQIKIGPVVLTLENKTGKRARISISTDHSLPIEIVQCGSRQEQEQETESNRPVENQTESV